ncbi:MBL fold metallo-hydrolase [Halomarina litorea]|uniref:MBL fold metallo-hydrolase n=1 Tax=Halomarina litorea TaxID=2961595 RepID=UPI0020C3FEF6|nr:MBL fold metallo-hydrolase [Halomarina sp. BCD28]
MKAISLGNTAFEGLNNAYLLEGEVTTLVDTGVSTPSTREQLEDGLREAGYEFADIDQVLLTHHHADHAGLAGAVQQESGAVVRVHEADAPLVVQDEDAEDAFEDRQRELFAEWGMPEESREELVGFLRKSSTISGDPAEVETFTDGARFDVGDGEFEAVHLPGHTAGLCGFAVESDYRSYTGARGEELFSGDALLPYYTPNVGGADVRVEDPLASYLDTLTRIVDAGYSRAWPGHRGPIVDPAGRAADIAVHHRERTDRVLSVLREHGPADAWTVGAHLFGGLSSIHILHGPGEASAHLGHLEDAGVVAATEEAAADGGDASKEYEIVDEDADVDALFPDVPGMDERPDPSA